MPPKNRKKKTREDYHILAESRGFRWLGPEVSTTKTLTTWECPRGHQWQAIYNNIQQGRDCPFCSRRKKPPDYHLIAHQRDFQWLGPLVTSIDTPTKWKCEYGHEWYATYRNILRGDDCPICLNTKAKEVPVLSSETPSILTEDIIDEVKESDSLELFQQVEEITAETLSLDWWGKKSIQFLSPFFILAKTLIRISTGFFSIEGYSLIKNYVEGKRLHILVGYDERSKQDVKMTLIEEIMDDLSKWHGNRRETVVNLVRKLQMNEFRMVDARTRQKDHSKIYIFDEDYVIGGSTNLTRKGLKFNHEGDLALSKKEEPDRVAWWCDQYETYWYAPDTEDISQQLLDRLEKWLNLRDPWDIYLKTIQILVPEDKPTAPRESYKTPVEFQMVVINRAIRQLNDWRGAMIVASTGLGKTVMATHIAYLMHLQKQILNVMVIAPKPVKTEWRKRLRSAGVPGAIFTRNLLDVSIDETKNQRALNDLLEALSDIDHQWLIIIDESQHFKNRERGIGGERLSFTRLIDTVNKKNCLVLLLTATPYATELDNINHQLLLLPHTNPKKQTHQQALPGLEPNKMYLKSWKINRVEDLVNLKEVGTVINTPYVAQNFAIQSKEGDYLMFGDTRKYIPKIQVNKVEVPVILEGAISNALDIGYFRHHLRSFKSRGKWIRSTSGVENEVIVAWGSSPWALQDVIEKTIQQKGGYDHPFIFGWEARYMYLSPILDDLHKLRHTDDEKFMRLYVVLKQLQQNGHKVLIFSERLATAVYIETGLSVLIPNLRMANTVKQEGKKFIQKDFQEVYDLMVGFAPRSNSSEDGIVPEDKYDVFITTDAYSEGINLQDASVVIHYDIAWTPDTIIQRAGRILRFWPEPRMVYLYLFAGKFQNNDNRKKESLNLENRLKKLITRTKEAEKFTEITIIPEDTQQFDTLRGLSSITTETLGQIGIRNLEDERFEVSPFLTHLTELKKNAKYAKTIPDDISSALTVGRIRKPQLYVLVKYQRKYHWMLYDTSRKKIEKIEEDQLLDRIKCSPDTQPALIDADEIEDHRQACINLWCQKKKLDEVERQEVKHICSLFLVPDDKPIDGLLESSQTKSEEG
ncbi:DEAD/DEAH box helicase family protein [candidate division KSB1 bacterium]|nr:DEAD/DEAH box helicase family protein [candidate division KSB1 bacterium]